MICSRHTLAAWTCAAVLIFFTQGRAFAQTEDPLATPDWGDYPLLMSQFGELCTMCEAYVECVPSPSEGGDRNGSHLYYFKTKTFWGQIATIWYYIAQWFAPVTNEGRPAAVYRFNADGTAADLLPTSAYLDVAEARVEIDGTWIDRNTNAWFTLENVPLGQCKRLGIPESMKMIEDTGPWQSRLDMSGAAK